MKAIVKPIAPVLFFLLALGACVNERDRPVDIAARARAGEPAPGLFELRVAVLNPRQVGKLLYFHQPTDGTAPRIVPEPLSPADQPARDYRLSMIKLVRITDGSVVGSAIPLRRPSYDRFGTRTWIETVEPPTIALSHIADHTGFSLSDNVAGYVLLLKATDEDTDWRVLEISRQQVEDALKTSLVIPDLRELPLANEQPEANEWWEAHERAAQAYHERAHE